MTTISPSGRTSSSSGKPDVPPLLPSGKCRLVELIEEVRINKSVMPVTQLQAAFGKRPWAITWFARKFRRAFHVG